MLRLRRLLSEFKLFGLGLLEHLPRLEIIDFYKWKIYRCAGINIEIGHWTFFSSNVFFE